MSSNTETFRERSQGDLRIVPASAIEPQEVVWLWHPYLPFGKLTLLEGDPLCVMEDRFGHGSELDLPCPPLALRCLSFTSKCEIADSLSAGTLKVAQAPML